MDANNGDVKFAVEAGPLVYDVAWSPDGKTLASGGARGFVKLWDAESGEFKNSIKAHTRGGIKSLEFSADGKWLASGGDDKRVKIWNRYTGRLNQTLEGLPDGVDPVSFSPDGSRVVGGVTRMVPNMPAKVWNLVTPKQPMAIVAHEGHWVRSVAFDANATRIVSGGTDHAVQLWDPVTGRELNTLIGHDGWVMGVAFAPDGQSILSCSADKSIKIWNAESALCEQTLELNDPVNCIDWQPNGKRFVSGSDGGILVIWDTQNYESISTMEHEPEVYSVAWSPDGKLLASGSRVGRDSEQPASIKIWNASTGAEILTIKTRSRQVNDLAFSPDGKRVVGCGIASNFKIWDVATGEELVDCRGHEGQIGAVAFNSDGSRVISVASDETVKIWDAATGENLLTLDEVPVGNHTSLALGSDDRRICCGTFSMLKIWDAPNTEEPDPASLGKRKYKPWVEDAAVRLHHVPKWHREEATRAEQEKDWFAATFHLRQLLQIEPEDEAINRRLEEAENQQDSPTGS